MMAVDIKDLTKKYQDLIAVDNITLEIKEGEIFGLVGPNGAGKSTLIGILSGSVKKSSGKVLIFSKDVEKDYLYTRNVIGVVPQETISDGFFTVKHIMEFQSGFFGVTNNSKQIEYILKRLSLWEKRNVPVEKLSGGMKRRLLVAKSMVHSPKLLILDEPTAGVDVFLRNHLWNYIHEINKTGTTIILTSHYIEEIEKLCHRVAIMDRGVIKTLGKINDVLREHECWNLEEAFIKLTTPEKNTEGF